MGRVLGLLKIQHTIANGAFNQGTDPWELILRGQYYMNIRTFAIPNYASCVISFFPNSEF
jgi:hypothetical protein